ncbi:hypothetical protein F2Q69_00023610 [Brassica cretica]|uniref:TIR domain-containing protein n=1 Tax=Brassica cretica TaxID=69181 RepID=A0A8S9QAP0_BRACR|nr:hypothetical protein F2Q69_00023610 [Brassica cretica]
MASSSSRTWRYRVFASFHGAYVRKTFLSHLRKQFNYNGITMFDDQGIEKSQTISPALTRAIMESKISIVCKEDAGQIVMTIFHGVDPSDVRKQTGEFGIAFNETCQGKTEEKVQKWSKALNEVGNIAGEHFLNWDSESNMIEKIAKDVSNKLNTTISRGFEDMVGIEAHMEKMLSLFHFYHEDEAMIFGICGPAGIGKTTIARALHSRLSSSFQLACFMENIREAATLVLTSAIPERLCDQKVLIILDDVDDLLQLEALADETNWFGPGSRIVVTTEDQEILEQHGVKSTYQVNFPNNKEASKIFYRYAFRQSSAPHGFEKVAERATKLCSNLPLGLRLMGSALRGKKDDECEVILDTLENSLDPKIEGVLRVGYDSLHQNDQSLFLHIAFFFNHIDDEHVMAMLADSNLDVRLGLKTLAYKSLIQISTSGYIVMHKLLQQVARQAVQRQEPWKRQIISDAHEIFDKLETHSGSRIVTGISFDISTIVDDMHISASAFKRMCNLRFLSVYQRGGRDTNVRLHVPKDMYFPPRLKLLHWEAYPRKCLPTTFSPEYLVELNLKHNELEKLWGGTQLLTNLQKIHLAGSSCLKELPDLSNATNLEWIDLRECSSLVEIPSSLGNCHKLEFLHLLLSKKLQFVPTHFNLASLRFVSMLGCWKMRQIPDFSRNITELAVTDTMLEQVPESVRHWSNLLRFSIYGSVNPRLNLAKTYPEHSGADIEQISDWVKDIHGLKELHIAGCPKLASLAELPDSLRVLTVDNCESLESVSFPFGSQIDELYFPNCFKLDGEARRVITQQSFRTYLAGKEIPAEFDHRAIGNTLTLRSDSYGFRICVLVSPKQYTKIAYLMILCRIRVGRFILLEEEMGWLGLDNEISFEFSTTSGDLKIIECGGQILAGKSDGSSFGRL